MFWPIENLEFKNNRRDWPKIRQLLEKNKGQGKAKDTKVIWVHPSRPGVILKGYIGTIYFENLATYLAITFRFMRRMRKISLLNQSEISAGQ